MVLERGKPHAVAPSLMREGDPLVNAGVVVPVEGSGEDHGRGRGLALGLEPGHEFDASESPAEILGIGAGIAFCVFFFGGRPQGHIEHIQPRIQEQCCGGLVQEGAIGQELHV